MIRGVPEGLFAILPPGYGDVYIVDVLQAGTSVLNSGLTVGSETPAPLDVVLSTRGGTLTGVVENARSQGVGFKTVVLVPLANKPPAWYKTASTDYHGAFSMSNIAPGEYRVFAWGLVPDNAWFDPDVIARSEGRGRAVHVTESSTESIDVKIIPAEGAR